MQSNGLRVLTDHEIFRRERRIRRARKYTTGTSIESLTALTPGDYVVHLEHGVGIYRGIEKVFFRESTVEAAVIEYEGGDRLNVPLYRIDQIERYRSAADITRDAPPPRLHSLGGKRWAQQRDRTRAAIQEMTAELLDLYARRKVATRLPHLPDTPWHRQLGLQFFSRTLPSSVRRRLTSNPTWSARGRWTGCSSATSATEKQRSPCAPRSRRFSRAGRWQCSYQRQFFRSSTRERSATVSRIF